MIKGVPWDGYLPAQPAPRVVRVPARTSGKAALLRRDIDLALKQGKTVHIASPKEGGGTHWTTVLPFRRREEWR